VTRNAAQRRSWTFYEAIKIVFEGFKYPMNMINCL